MWRMFKLVGAIVVAAVAFAAAVLLVPQITETVIRLTCSQDRPSKTCIVRMRAMGDVWALKGNLLRAQQWYAKAADHGDLVAAFDLGWAYEQTAAANLADLVKQSASGLEPTRLSKPDFNLAATAYRKAAERGFAPAMNNLGQLYSNGVFGPAGPGSPLLDEGFRWMLRAAEAGNPVAAMNVSLAYREGRGVARDAAKASHWATWTAEKTEPHDLSEPTLSRTNLFGMPLPPELRAHIRASAKAAQPVTTNFRPLQPDPRLPTFGSVSSKLH